MTERFCKKCNKMCHCPNAEGECTNCECNNRAEDQSFENEWWRRNRRHRRMRIMSIIKKIFLIISLLAFTSCVAVGPRCTYTQEGTKLSSWIWFTKEIPVDLSKDNCN